MKIFKGKNRTIQNGVRGFKVFDSDWTCKGKQYTCPGKFEEEGELVVGHHGMHFCKVAADCFKNYDFNSNNKVAEVIAYGKVLTDGTLYCTDKLEIVRQIPWDEVLRIVNIRKNCTGCGNVGDCNTGSYNTGCRNTGNCNTGSYNTGFKNTANYNTGNCNTGDWNAGNCNTGSYNTGFKNTGFKNAGDCNTGNCNTGSYNTGDWNKSSHNTGCFNTEEPKILLFNKPSDMTYRDWLESDAKKLLDQMKRNDVYWVFASKMTDEEKAEHPTYKTTGGYLKEIDYSECAQLWWNSLSDIQKDIIKEIPNFDAEIFFECTGIRVEG